MQHFDEDPTGKEPKFAGSGVDRLLNPSGSGLPIWRATDQPSITVQISQQTKLYDLGSREKNRAYIFPRLHADTYVSATRIYDFAYSLDKSICDQETLNELNDEKSANHFPCFSADGTTLIPLVTGEVKVLGHYRKQREQQEVYATFFIMAWLILRAHMKGKDRWESNEDFSQGVHHCCFSMSPSSLEIWEYKPKVSSVTGDFRVQGQLLCSGHPCDEVFMKQVYIPWRRYVMKRSIIQQWLYLVPAIRAYAKLPWPRPFSRPEPLFLRARELKPASYELDSVTFSTAPSPERERLKELIAKAEEAAALAARIKKRKKLEGFPTSSTGTPTESQSVTGSFISSFG